MPSARHQFYTQRRAERRRLTQIRRRSITRITGNCAIRFQTALDGQDLSLPAANQLEKMYQQYQQNKENTEKQASFTDIKDELKTMQREDHQKSESKHSYSHPIQKKKYIYIYI